MPTGSEKTISNSDVYYQLKALADEISILAASYIYIQYTYCSKPYLKFLTHRSPTFSQANYLNLRLAKSRNLKRAILRIADEPSSELNTTVFSVIYYSQN